MTTIETIPAGRDLDARIAERVMGWRNIRNIEDDGRARELVGSRPGSTYEWEVVPRYSTERVAALIVEDRISALKLSARYMAKLIAALDIPIEPYPQHAAMFTVYEMSLWHLRRAEPHHICRAALGAVEEA